MEKQKLSFALPVIILGIFSILFCWCYGVFGLLLNIIALILAHINTKSYKENPDLYSNYSSLKVGKVINYIGLILNILFLIFIIWFFMLIGFENLQDEELMQEKIREIFGV